MLNKFTDVIKSSGGSVNYGASTHNIAAIIFDIIITVVLFVVTARILEKKIEV